MSLVDADTESTFRISIDGKKIVLEAMSQKEIDRMTLEASDKVRKVQSLASAKRGVIGLGPRVSSGTTNLRFS